MIAHEGKDWSTGGARVTAATHTWEGGETLEIFLLSPSTISLVILAKDGSVIWEADNFDPVFVDLLGLMF